MTSKRYVTEKTGVGWVVKDTSQEPSKQFIARAINEDWTEQIAFVLNQNGSN